MIRFTEHTAIDRKKWDDCIKASSDGNIFVCSFYLDAVCESWSALILGDYEAVFPLAGGSKYRIHYLYQPFFTRYFGVYSRKKAPEKLLNDFLAAIPDKFKYMEFCLHEGQSVESTGFEPTERKFQLLHLDEAHQALQKSYSDNAKRSIKKALKAGAIVKEGIKGKEVVELFRSTKGQELEVFKDTDYKKLLRLMEACEQRGQAETIGVYSADGGLSAAGFFMRYGNRYVFLKSGVTDEGKSHGFMHLLFDTFIQKHAGSNTILDFGGSSVESVARFYKNFGAKDCVYLQVQKNRLPRLVNWLKSLKK
ncbi:MAG: hypothetical protein JWO09_3033 [Bacteroidetes bacterium]|nr:hypothetical protein [Bacteroidota bacterium]